MNASLEVGKKFLAAGQKVPNKIFLAIEVVARRSFLWDGKNLCNVDMIKTDSEEKKHGERESYSRDTNTRSNQK